MANNRLWIVDDETGDYVLLAKGWQDGWAFRWENTAVRQFLSTHDAPAANGGKTKLRIADESDSAFLKHKMQSEAKRAAWERAVKK